MLRIRLKRVGAKKQPSYRIVVAENRSPRDGRFVEAIGLYNPRTQPPTVRVEEARALHWLSNGAQPSEAVAGFLKNAGTLDRLARLRRGENLADLLQEAAAAQPSPAPEPAPAEAQGPTQPPQPEAAPEAA
jgi:small subunit ribosomal protein S16